MTEKDKVQKEKQEELVEQITDEKKRQDYFDGVSKPQNIVQREKELDDLNDKIEGLYDVVEETQYLLDILKNANIPADSPLGALIKLMLDRVKSIDKKVENLNTKHIVPRSWLEIENIRRDIRSLAKLVEQKENRIDVLEAEARWYSKRIDELEKEKEKIAEEQIVEKPIKQEADIDREKEEKARKQMAEQMEKAKPKKTAKPITTASVERPLFSDGPGESIDEIGGTNINENIVNMINHIQPDTAEELGKIIKSFKPHLKPTTLATYVRGYAKYMKMNWSVPFDVTEIWGWVTAPGAPLTDKDIYGEAKTPIVKQEAEKKKMPVQELKVKEPEEEWDDEILTDTDAAQVVSIYDGKITERRLGMVLNTIQKNSNKVERKELQNLVQLNVTDVIRHARYATKRKLVRLWKGNYSLKEQGKQMLDTLSKKYDLYVAPPDFRESPVTKTTGKRKRRKRPTGMHRLNNKLSRKIGKKYDTSLYKERYEDILMQIDEHGPLAEEDIITKVSDVENENLSRNTIYAHLRYGCERRDVKRDGRKYKILPNAKRIVEKIKQKRGGDDSPSSAPAEETIEDIARRETKESYDVVIDDEKYQKLKNTLDSAFGYKKSIKEFGNTKSWTQWEAGAYLRYGVKIGEIMPVGKAEKPDGTTQYALVKNKEKLPRERKEIVVKSKGTIRDKKTKQEDEERASKNYSIFQRKSKK